MRHLFPILLLTLAGCGREVDVPRTDRAAREKLAREAAAQPPRVQRHSVAGGELLVLEVPVALPYGLVDTQHCFVWRDEASKTSSISCPSTIETGPGRGE